MSTDKIDVTIEEYTAIMDKAIADSKGDHIADTLIKLLEMARKYHIVENQAGG